MRAAFAGLVIALFAGETAADTGWADLYEDTAVAIPQVNLGYRFSDRFSGYVHSGDPLDAGASGIIAAGGEAKLYGGDFGDLSVTFGGRHEEWQDGDLQTLSSGFRHALPGGWASLTAQANSTCDQDGNWRHGWRARIDTQVADRLRLHAGFASAMDPYGDVVFDADSQFFGFTYDLDERLSIRLDYRQEDREQSFLQRVLTLGLATRFGEWLSGYLNADIRPEPDVPDRRDIWAGGAIRLHEGRLGRFSLILDSRHGTYRRGEVDIQSTGFRHDFLDGRAWLSAQAINSHDADGAWKHGWRTQLDAQLTQQLRVHAGLVDAPEILPDTTLDAEAQYFGFAFLKQGLDVHLDYRREARAGTSPQQVLTLGLTTWF